MARAVNHRLAAVREAAGVTRAELAERLGATRQTVHKMETGGIQLSLRHVYALAEALGVEPAALLLDGERAEDEARMIRAFRSLGAEPRSLAMRMIVAMAMTEQDLELMDLAHRLTAENRGRLVALARALESPEGSP
jgi:transcriptional regulator with XRE-family HTH domain